MNVYFCGDLMTEVWFCVKGTVPWLGMCIYMYSNLLHFYRLILSRHIQVV